MPSLTVQLIGGPTALLTLGGLRLLTDPTFDDPGVVDRGTAPLTKLVGPALSADQLGPLDVVLLSHDQHADNLDRAGLASLARVPRTLTTVPGAERLGGQAIGMRSWDTITLPRPEGGGVRVTALPAEHGPHGSLPSPPDVIGFLLQGEDLPTVYVSGDNATVETVEEIVARVGRVDVAVLFCGAARSPRVPGVPLTLTAERAVRVAELVGASSVVPVHFEGWAHFSEDADALRAAFAAAGRSDRLRLLELGQKAAVS